MRKIINKMIGSSLAMDNQKLINFLNQLLSNHFAMYVKLHRYHWFVDGMHFFQLHTVFEDMYKKFGKDLDEVAERVLMIQGEAVATMSTQLEEATLAAAGADETEEEMIEQRLEDYNQLVSEIKEQGIPLAEENKDEPTLDLLIGLQQDYEKYIWMLSAYQDQDK